MKVVFDKNTHDIKDDDGEQLLDDLPISKVNKRAFPNRLLPAFFNLLFKTSSVPSYSHTYIYCAWIQYLILSHANFVKQISKFER